MPGAQRPPSGAAVNIGVLAAGPAPNVVADTARPVAEAVPVGRTVGVPVRDAATGGGADADLIAALIDRVAGA